MGKQVISVRDYDDQGSTITLRTLDYTAANYDARNTALDAMRAAFDAVMIGAIKTDVRQALDIDVNQTNPLNTFAQRQTKWMVRGLGADGKRYTLEIPTADLTLLQPASNKMDISAGAGQTLVTELETNWLDEQGGAMTVLEVIHVSRP